MFLKGVHQPCHRKLSLSIGSKGKSKVGPSVIQAALHKLNPRNPFLLVLTTSTIDVVDMQKQAKVDSCYRMGGHRKGGVPWWRAKIVFATAGLARQWYASEGADFLRGYGGVFFDEVGDAERDPEYALLWQVARHVSLNRSASWPLRLVAGSATMSDRMREIFSRLDPRSVVCHTRPFPVQRYVVEVDTMEMLWQTIPFIVANLFRRHITTLVFLPGKTEIANVREALVAMQVPAIYVGSGIHAIEDLHAELEPNVIERVKRPQARPRCILATSFAEACVTIADVDHVVDAGLSRKQNEYHDIAHFFDTTAPERAQLQRAGRSGRVKPGVWTLVKMKDAPPPREPRLSVASVSKVLALEQHHLNVSPSECTLCEIPEDVIEQARAELTSLNMTSQQLLDAVAQIPLPLRDAAVLLRAIDKDCGYEAAAVLAVKSAGRWKGGMELTLHDILDACTKPLRLGKKASKCTPRSSRCDDDTPVDRARPSLCGDGTPVAEDAMTVHEKITFLDKVQLLFKELVSNHELYPSWEGQRGARDDRHNRRGALEERLAFSFLVCPERLVWNIKGEAAFLGSALIHNSKSEFFVSILMSNQFKGLRCNFQLPVTEWVSRNCGLTKPTQTANVIGDSTFGEFRSEIFFQLRELGYDLRRWCSKGGAWEEEVAVRVATSRFVDLNIVAPNGNRLSCQKEAHFPVWLNKTCGKVAAAMKATSKFAVVFVGDASLSPGVEFHEAYESLIPMMHQKFERLNVAVVKDAPGIVLAPDGIHWRFVSAQGVCELVVTMVTTATNTASIKETEPPNLWHWRFNEQNQRHQPCCMLCDRIASALHLGSQQHLKKAGGTQLGFNFPDREKYVSSGVAFKDEDGLLVKTTYLDADNPLPDGGGADLASQVDERRAIELIVTQTYGGPVARSGMPERFDCNVNWGQGKIETCSFIYYTSGRERDAFAEATRSYVMKVHKLDSEGPNPNHDEWDSYLTLLSFRHIMPFVYGYFEVEVQSRRFAVLLAERLAWTFEELLQSYRKSPPTLPNLYIVHACVLSTYTTMKQCAQEGLFEHDWHIANIGFTDTSASKMVLVDWQRNHLAPARVYYKKRWEKAFRCFYKFLPGPHTYDRNFTLDNMRPAERASYLQWRTVLTHISKALEDWWDTTYVASHEMPSETQSKELDDTLRRIIESAGAEVTAPQSYSSSSAPVAPIGTPVYDIAAPTRFSNETLSSIGGTIVPHDMNMHATPFYVTRSPSLLSPQRPLPPQSNTRATREQLDLTDAANQLVRVVRAGGLVVRVGARAIESILEGVIAEQVAHSQREFKFPRTTSKLSIPLSHRLLYPTQSKNVFNPSRPTKEGHDLKLIFSLLLKLLEEKIEDRMSQEPIDN